jgi:hypothetical protein
MGGVCALPLCLGLTHLLKIRHKSCFFYWGGTRGTSPQLGGTMYPAVPVVPTPMIQLNWRHLKNLKFLNFTLKVKILFKDISPFNVLLNAETEKKSTIWCSSTALHFTK